MTTVAGRGQHLDVAIAHRRGVHEGAVRAEEAVVGEAIDRRPAVRDVVVGDRFPGLVRVEAHRRVGALDEGGQADEQLLRAEGGLGDGQDRLERIAVRGRMVAEPRVGVGERPVDITDAFERPVGAEQHVVEAGPDGDPDADPAGGGHDPVDPGAPGIDHPGGPRRDHRGEDLRHHGLDHLGRDGHREEPVQRSADVGRAAAPAEQARRGGGLVRTGRTEDGGEVDVSVDEARGHVGAGGIEET